MLLRAVAAALRVWPLCYSGQRVPFLSTPPLKSSLRLAGIKWSRSSEPISTTVEAQILAATIYLGDKALNTFA